MIVLLRIAMGWMFLYAGITKVINPMWTAEGFLRNAKAFTGFFQWFALPENIGWVNVVNEWGLTLLGVALILGIGVRIASVLGVALMLLYYLPLGFPKPSATAFIVDQHVVYALVLMFFAAVRAGRIYGLEAWCSELPICRRFPRLRAFLG